MKKSTLASITSYLICSIFLEASALTLADTSSEMNRRADQHFQKATELVKRMEYEAAIAEYKKVLNFSSESKIAQDAKYWIGQSHFKAGQFDAAQVTFAELIEQYPTSAIVPVSKLMVERVEKAKENEAIRRTMNDALDKGFIIDPKTEVKYTKMRSFTGKRDVVTQVAWQLSLSPNGKFLLWNKLVIPLDGREPFNLVEMPAALGIWSPDGEKVVFRLGGAIWVIPVSPETGQSMGPPRKLIDGKYQHHPFVGWSPDSEKIVFERNDKEGRGNICTLSVRDGTLTQITDDPVREWRPIWSPDGKSIAYNRGSELRLMPARGGPSKKLIDNGLARFWSPDSKWLVYFRYDGLRFYRLADGYEFAWGAPNGAGRFISWSPDGKKMIFYHWSYDWRTALKVVSASGGPSFELGRQSKLEPYRQYWSPDSRMIVTEGEGGFWVVPLAGGEPFPLKIDVSVEGKAEPCRLSPDGRKLLFGVERGDKKVDLYVAPVSLNDGQTTGSPAIVFSGWKIERDRAGDLLWSPDGAKIAVIHEGNLWMTSPEGGEPVQVTMRKHPDDYRALGWSRGGDPAWSPDGTMISYKVYHSEEEQFLRVIPSSGNEDTIFLDIRSKNRYEWSADSKDLLSSSEEAISAISVADGKSRQFLDLKELSMDTWCFASSPDRKTLAFIGYDYGGAEDGHLDSYKIFTVPAQGGTFTEFAADDPGEKYWLWWSPNGKWISYQSDGFIKTRPEATMWEADFEEIIEKVSRLQ
ncbi:MAG: tetratricopeptide repeat protein [Planctomycetota bacterium]|jgi:Tol biopolymer transport system component